MLEYKHFKNRESWLKGREKFPGIGASEAAAIVHCSNWLTPTDLWKQKVGLAQPKDLSDNELVQYGIQAEEHIRGLFLLKHEEYTLTHRPYDFLYQTERPWLRCTLDGELEYESGGKGILEIKSAMISSKSHYAKWKDQIPENYLVQLLHQFLATGFEFAYLYAELMFSDGSSQLRPYYFLAKDYYDEMQWLLEQEETFWQSVLDKNATAVKLFL